MPTATEIQGSKYLDAKINLEVYLDIKILEIKIPPQGHHQMTTHGDPIDLILKQWSNERPKLDSSGFAVVGRILLLGKLLESRVTQVLAPLSLSAFDVLATLRRQGAPFSLTPTQLCRATLLTSGAMTSRLDRLEKAKLVQRSPDPEDRRGVRVALTDQGLELVDRAIETRFEEALDAVSQLPPEDRVALGDLLRTLTASLPPTPRQEQST